MTILDRVMRRLPDESSTVIVEYIDTMTDRLRLRLGTEELPKEFETICADAVVKMYRRTYYEGISSEGVATISTSFVEDILAEYEKEITLWKSNHANGEARTVMFL